VLGVGVDWAESFHHVALGRPGEGVIEQSGIEHGPAGVARLVARCRELEAAPAEVRVVLETRHGPLVEALADAGFTVLPVNPDLVARRRSAARKKDDQEDARICCLLALDTYLELRKLIPQGETGAEPRAIARDDERAARDERRIGNLLRADLLTVFPAAIDIAGGDLGAPVFLSLLERWPSAADLAAASPEEVEEFARSRRRGWPGRFSEHVTRAMAEPHLPVRPELARAKAGSIRLATAQPLLLRAQRKAWERRMGELPLGAPRTGRDKAPKDPDPGKAFGGGEIYLSMPGPGDRLAARVAGEIGEIGERPEQFTTSNALQCYAGRAPVTRRSGRSEFTIARRLACNRHLGEAVQQWAFCSLSRSARAREFCDSKIAGDTRHAALRALGSRWIEVLWHCLRLGVRYDEAIHAANRNRARKKAA
jgi:transposase